MARPLKMFMRGDRVSRLQQLLTRQGCEISDEPGRFGTATRDAVRKLQREFDLNVTGIADSAFMALIGGNEESAAQNQPSDQQTVSEYSAQARLEALTRLLIQKGIITESELQELLQASQPLRISQPPLI